MTIIFKISTRVMLVIIATLLASMTYASDVITLRLHQFLPIQSTVPKNILSKWIADVEAASNGRLKIEHFGSMALGGKPPELYDQAVDGVADIIWTVAGYTPGRFPETEVFELPFMMTTAEAASAAYWNIAQDTLINDEMKDTHVLGLWVHGPGVIHSKKPITSIDDLKGVKLRAPNRAINLFFSNLGAEVIGMPVPAVPENLSKGVIDATIIPWEVTPSLKVSELVKNHTMYPNNPLYTTTFIFTMNKDRYNALPDDLKVIIDNASGLEFSKFAGRQMQADDAPGLKIAQDLGNNIIELSDEDIQQWKTASLPTIKQWIAEMDAKGIDGAALIERAQSLMKEN